MQKNSQNHSFYPYFNSDFGNFLYDTNIFFFSVEFNPAKWNLPLQSGIHFFNSPNFEKASLHNPSEHGILKTNVDFGISQIIPVTKISYRKARA